MKIWQLGVSFVLVVALAASLPGLYYYTEAGSASRQPLKARTDDRASVDQINLKTVEDVSHAVPSDPNQLPETPLELNRVRGAERRRAERILRIEINTAPKDRLDVLPGVGPATAEAVVKYRENNTIDELSDLEEIEGVGPATAENMSKRLLLDGQIPPGSLED